MFVEYLLSIGHYIRCWKERVNLIEFPTLTNFESCINICTYDEICARKMQLGMKSVVRALNLIWSIRGILPEKGIFKLRNEKSRKRDGSELHDKR